MDSVLEHHCGFGFGPGGVSKPNRLWLEGMQTDTFGDVAVMTGLWCFQSDGESDAAPQRGPVTMVAVWTAGDWRFVHLNFSNYSLPVTP